MPRKHKLKRRPNGSGSIRKRIVNGYNYYEARYTVGYDSDGKQIQKSISGKSQQEVQAKLIECLHAINTGSYISPVKMTVGDWLNEWSELYLVGVKPATVKNYKDHIRLNLIPYIGGIKLQKLSADVLQRMYNTLHKDKGLSPKTIKNVHGVLHRALSQACLLGYLQTNPLNGVILPRVEKKESGVFEDKALQILLEASEGSPYRNIIYVTVFTGLRQAEVLALTWSCVNFETGTLHISKQHGKNKLTKEYEFAPLKNDKSRTLTVAPIVMECILAEKQKQEYLQKRIGAAYNNADDLVFTTDTGRYINNQTLYCAYKKILKRAGIADMNFHSLRHTFATNSIRVGDDIKTVQENLGHHSAAFTLGQYGHATQEMKISSAKRMDKFSKDLLKNRSE